MRTCFQANTVSICYGEKEWEQRQKTRGEEVAAITKAMEILKEEAVKEAFLQDMLGHGVLFHFD